MNKESIDYLFEPRRQSPVAIFMILYTFFRRFISVAWYAIIPMVVGGGLKNTIAKISFSVVGLIIAAVILAISLLSYFRYYYSIDETSFNIQKGVFGRKKINLPFERIQNINFEQNLVHQIFGVVSLQIDTAGSSGNEIKVDALPKKEAEAIRDYILEQKREISALSGEIEETEAATETEIAAIERKPDELILSLNIMDLMKVGVSQNHIKTALIILTFGYSFMDDVEDLFKINVVDMAVENVDFIGNTFIATILFFLFVSFMITLVRTVLKNFNLRFFKSHEGFKVTSGLFTRQEIALRKEKIQIIQWTNNPIRKLFKIFTLDIKQAVAGVVMNRKQKAEIPGCYQNQVDQVLNSCFPDLKEDRFKEHRIEFAFVIRRFLFIGLIPPVIFLVSYYFTLQIQLLVIGIAFPFVVFMLLWVYHKKYRIYIGEDYIKIKKGIFGTSNVVFPYYKVQAVEIMQTIYQRKKGLGNLGIHTANGTISVPYFEITKARALKNYILYKVEKNNQAWM